MRPRTLITLVILLLLVVSIARCQQANDGVILNGPQTQVISPGETAIFNCHAQGYTNHVYWYINGGDPDQSALGARGFTFTYIELPPPNNQLREYNNTITVEARPSNNGTRIGCTATGVNPGQHDFQEGTLIIAGLPLRPIITNFSQESVHNSSNVTYRLYWSAPFTWPGFPITSYNITVFSHLSNDSTTTIISLNDSQSQILSLDGTTHGDSCYRLTFFVSASNLLGEGEHTMMQSGHHIIPGEVGDIETTVTFLSNGTPHLWMSFSVPRICPVYQTGIYSIIISDDVGSPTHTFEPQEYTQESENEMSLIVKEIKTGLNFGKQYEIEVAAMSMGVLRSRRKTFSTVFDTQLVCPSSSVVDTTATQPKAFTHTSAVSNALSNATTDAANVFKASPGDNNSSSCIREAMSGDSNNSSSCIQQVTNCRLHVGITAGITAFLAICFLCLLLLLYLTCRKMNSNQKLCRRPVLQTDGSLAVNERKPKSVKPPNLMLQAKNPIYEGAMYETTPGESLKSLLSPCSVPCTPLAEAATRYTFEFPPKLPPPRKGSVSVPPKLKTHEEVKLSSKLADMPPLHITGDEYMIMNAEVFESNNVSEAQGNSKVNNITCSNVEKYGDEDEYVTFK